MLWSDGLLSFYGSGAVSSDLSTWWSLSSYASNVKSLELEDGITSYSFYSILYSFSNLKTVTLPDSIKTIGNSSFSGCSRLTDVYYGGSSSDWNKINFNSGNQYLTRATIHYSSDQPIREEPVLAGAGSKVTPPWEPISLNQA